MMQTQKQVITFMTKEQFSKILTVKCLFAAIDDCITEYHDEIKELLGLMLPRLAHGFSEQRGAIFGFGPKKGEDTGTLLKVTAVTDKEKKHKLRNTPVHNLNKRT